MRRFPGPKPTRDSLALCVYKANERQHKARAQKSKATEQRTLRVRKGHLFGDGGVQGAPRLCLRSLVQSFVSH